MRKVRYIFATAAVLLLALAATSCVHPVTEEDYGRLMVSVYIPDVLSTKAETGPVDPVGANEKKITSLQVWVFLPDGTPVSYRAFRTGEGDPAFDPDETGLGRETITRFGLILTKDKFAILSRDGATADVYAIANADVNLGLTNQSSRNDLDNAILTGSLYGGTTESLTMSVPNGIPMSGVLKGAEVSGGYPVLSIPTLTLTRAVSKLRFVFAQQAKDTDPTQPFNSNCVIKRIVFDGTDAGAGSQIADREYIFTTQKLTGTDHIFSIQGYSPLKATIASVSGNLIENSGMARIEDPILLSFRSAGHENESAQQYEDRLDAVVSGLSSQVGPIYIRETDKPVSGTIYFSTTADGAERSATFSMETGDVLTRNHSWIVYAYFAEETMTLQVKVAVLPWTWQRYTIDYTSDAVNVVRRFEANETSPSSFTKVQTSDGFYDVTFWHTFEGAENIIVGDMIIATPVSGVLHAVPVSGTDEGVNPISDAIIVSPVEAVIYPSNNPASGTVEACHITFTIQRNPKYADTNLYPEDYLEGQYMDLHFYVEYNEREIDLGSESIDYYRFRLKKNWKQ